MQKPLLFAIWVLFFSLLPRAAFASPPKVIDYISNVSVSATEDDKTNAEVWGLWWTPLADTGLCEVEVPLRRYATGATTSANVSLAVVASPSNSFFYSFNADSTVDWSLIGSSYANKVFTFYNDIHATDGACPVMYGGHEYRLVFTFTRNNGTGTLGVSSWTSADFSRYTQTCNGTGCTVPQGGEPEIIGRGYGPMTDPNMPGSSFYENADPLAWVTSSSYGFTDQNFGALGNMLRDIVVWLFYPTQEINTIWNGVRMSFQAKAPVSYLVEIKDMLSSASYASASFPSVSVVFPTQLGSVSVDLFSEQTIEALAPSGFLSALRSLASVALWMTFVWFVYHELDVMWKR